MGSINSFYTLAMLLLLLITSRYLSSCSLCLESSLSLSTTLVWASSHSVLLTLGSWWLGDCLASSFVGSFLAFFHSVALFLSVEEMSRMVNCEWLLCQVHSRSRYGCDVLAGFFTTVHDYCCSMCVQWALLPFWTCTHTSGGFHITVQPTLC